MILIIAVLIMTPLISSAHQKARHTFTIPDTSYVETTSCRTTQAENESINVPRLLDTEGFKLVMQNINLEVWFREETAGIRVRDKKSGYIWGGLA